MIHSGQKSLAKFFVSLLVALVYLPASAADTLGTSGLPTVIPEDVGMSSARLGLITDMLEQHIDDGRIAGLVAAVARKGKVVYLQSIGFQNIERQLPMRSDSIFQIRSMSKPITAVAVMQLVESGKLKLNDPVSKFLPRFANLKVFVNPRNVGDKSTRPARREMTIEDLLLNTSGLSHRFSLLYRNNKVRSRADTLEQLVDKVAGVPLVADPGSRWIYSIASTVLGHIVEIVSGQPFDSYLSEHVFSLLEMNDTSFYVAENKLDRLARPYAISNGGFDLKRLDEMAVPITQNPALKEGAVGLVSTVPDYLRFLQSLLNGGELGGQRVLSQNTVAEMVQNHIDEALLPIATDPRYPMLDRGWGYGFAVVTDKSKSSFGVNNGEFGWGGSLGTFAWADPKTNTIAILMLQVSPANAYRLSSKFKALVYQSIIEQ